MQRLSLWELCEVYLEGGLLYWARKACQGRLWKWSNSLVMEGSGTGVFVLEGSRKGTSGTWQGRVRPICLLD